MDPVLRMKQLAEEAGRLIQKSTTPEWTEGDANRATEVHKEYAALEKLVTERDAATKALQGLNVPTQDNTSDKPDRDVEKGGTLGQRFTSSKAYRSFKTAHPDSPSKGTPIMIEAKEVGPDPSRVTRKSLLTSDGVHANAPVREAGVEDLVYRAPRTLLDVVTVGNTNLTWTEYRQIISKTNNAKIVPEATTYEDINGSTVTEVAAGLKPISTLTTQVAEAKAHTYADGMVVTNQELSDDGLIQTLIDSTLRENLEIEIERILLNGTGEDGEPKGILATSGILQQAYTKDLPTTVRKAITKVRNTAGGQIRGVLLNPEDNEEWDLLQDTTGRYLGAGPFQSGPGTAWGYERIESQVLPAGTALIGDFKTIHLLIKDAVTVLAFNQHKDFAQRNLAYIRAELRAMQMIRNAARLCVVDLTPGS